MSEGKVRLQLGYLGGAPLIWVLESPWVATCARCSPCCPNAGDLNTPGESMIEYCLPPEEMPEGFRDKLNIHLLEPKQ